ncbi:hypothetical protein BDV95DRAFT_348511 [Massariosphaeria phaeospora]|uniref:Uncharacterized protein n=1 Tax=Massariosphaeria phaeospora TaxID=100035 RepID=A0A7C8I8X8_9PLEO|nr:hypothetical protein BDV95DRAFT_348511 [Massariosphaeria phaeospora]
MPPKSLPTGLVRTSPSTSNAYSPLSQIVLLVLVLGTAVRWAVFCFFRSKRRRGTQFEQLKERNPGLCQIPREKIDPCRPPRCNHQLPPTFRPIYPWIGPPQPLPGPYDPSLYPLPTLRRHSCCPPAANPSENSTVPYTRRVSTNSMPGHPSILHGTVTTSSNGWRRKQWVVTGG